MKFTIMGYSQERAVEFGLDIVDLTLIRWFADFQGTERMVEHVENGVAYYWLKYDYVIEDLPILNIKKDTLMRKFKALAKKGILDTFTLKQGGTFSFYRFGTEYTSLLASRVDREENVPYGKKSVPPTEKNPYPYGKNSVTNNPSTKDTSTKSIKHREREAEPEVVENFLNRPGVREAFAAYIEMRKENGWKTMRVSKMRWIANLEKRTDKEIVDTLAVATSSNWKDITENANIKQETTLKQPRTRENKSSKGKYTFPSYNHVETDWSYLEM